MNSSSDLDALIQHLFDEVADLDTEKRAACLNQTCAGNPVLRRELEALLEAEAHTADLFGPLDHPVFASVEANVRVGQIISHYQILEKLGGGGMGVVYKAHALNLDRSVALKFLPPHMSLDEEAKQRFIREAKTASALDHPNICTIYDIDQTKTGQLFIVMACYEGETLKKKIAQGPLQIEEARDYAVQVAQGLSRAHETGIIHRDIKPANVMVTKHCEVKIVDFGLAKISNVDLTQMGMRLGTVFYLSPEQSYGEAVDHRTDLWSLGVVFYEMLTGERPFRGENTDAIIYTIRHDAPRSLRTLRPEASEALEQIIEKALMKNPDERYQHAREMVDDLVAPRRTSVEAQPETRSPSTLPSRRRRAWRYGSLAVPALVLALVGYLVSTGARAPINSIAVLPLVNLSGNPQQEALANGITEELITALNKIGALRTIGRRSVMRFKGSNEPITDIARTLKVRHVVEGSIVHDGNKVRITVNLFEATSEIALWGNSFEHEMRDVLALQGKIALAVAHAIKAKVTPEDQARLSTIQIVDTVAYNLYLKGRYFLYQRTRADKERATHYFQVSIAQDSTFAPAYAGLANSYLFQFFWGLSREEGEPKAKQALVHALELDASLSEAYVTKGLFQYFFDGQWNEAEQTLRYAVELNADNSEAHRELAWLLLRSGRIEQALVEAKHALDLDPLFADAHMTVAQAYYFNRQYDHAIAQVQSLHELYPGYTGYIHGILVQSYLQKGLKEETLLVLEKLAFESTSVGYFGNANAVLGRREEALQALDTLMARRERGYNVALEIAKIHTGLGNKDEAFLWLERANDPGPYGLVYLIYIRIDPLFDPLHADPRFKVLLEKVDDYIRLD